MIQRMNRRHYTDHARSKESAHKPWGEDCDVDGLHDADARRRRNTTEGLHDEGRKSEKDARDKAAAQRCDKRQDKNPFVKRYHGVSRAELSNEYIDF